MPNTELDRHEVGVGGGRSQYLDDPRNADRGERSGTATVATRSRRAICARGSYIRIAASRITVSGLIRRAGRVGGGRVDRVRDDQCDEEQSRVHRQRDVQVSGPLEEPCEAR